MCIINKLTCVVLASLMCMLAGQAMAEDITIGAYDPAVAAPTDQTSTLDKEVAKNVSGPLFRQTNDPMAGNPHGQITIADFFDYQCSHCQHMTPTLDALVKANPKLRVVYKEFPIRGDVSENAAKACLAAKLQGKYLPFHEALMKLAGNINDEALLKIAKHLDLNIEQWKADMKSAAVAHELEANQKLAEELHLSSTPGFFIGKTKGSEVVFINGAVDQAYMQNAINKIKQTD